MTKSKIFWCTAVAGMMMYLWFFATADAVAAVRVMQFVNDTGKPADDLHIQFKEGVTIDFTTIEPGTNPSKPYTRPFNSERGTDGGTTHNLYNGTVAAAGTAQVRATAPNSPTITISQWWWTEDGNSQNDGTKIVPNQGGTNGGKEPDKKSTFSGTATGNGQILVLVNDSNNFFQTTAGHSAEQSAAAFQTFLNGLSSGGFALVHSAIYTPDSVRFAGNVLGDPNKELIATVQTQDSTQQIIIEDVTDVLPTVSEWGLIVMAGLLLTVGAVVIVRRRLATA